GPLVLDPLEDDPLRLDRHPERAATGPVLGVGGIVLDRRIEPDPVALLVPLIEGRLEWPPASSAAAAAATPPAPRAGLLLAGALGLALSLVGRSLFFLGLRLGLRLTEFGLDLGLDLVAEVELGLGLLALGGQAVAVAEVTQ